MTTVYKDLVISALRELGDGDYQRRVWVEGSPDEMSSMDEAVAALFSDSGLDRALDRKLTVFSPAIDERLRTLGQMLRGHILDATEKGTAAVINTSEWQAVRASARNILDLMQRETGA